MREAEHRTGTWKPEIALCSTRGSLNTTATNRQQRRELTRAVDTLRVHGEGVKILRVSILWLKSLEDLDGSGIRTLKPSDTVLASM